jgi:hypothetical protein
MLRRGLALCLALRLALCDFLQFAARRCQRGAAGAQGEVFIMIAITQTRWPKWAVGASLLVAASLPMRAQTPPPPVRVASAPPVRPDPADPKARVPAVIYQSPLQTDQRFEEPAVAPWRQSNEQVRQRGGWRGSIHDAPPADTAAPVAAAASAPKPGHSGHQMK